MTTRAADEVRLKPARQPWRFGESWLSGRALVAAAALSILVLFVSLWWMLRDKPMPRRRADFPAPPQLTSQIASAQERLKVNPQDIAALVELGTLQFQKGKESYVDAINALEEARDLGALDPRIFYCLGIMYQEEGLYPFALTEYQRFLRHYPEDKEVRLLAAKLYYRMGLFSEAIGEYERLKFSDPNDPLVEENLGLSLWAAKQMERAVASFGQLKASGGDFTRRAEFYLGQIELANGKFPEAADHFTKSGAADSPLPGMPPERVYADMGTVYQKLGRYEEAKTAWQAVVKVVPNDAKAHSALREATRKADAAKKAAEKAEKAAKAAAEKAAKAAEKAAKAAADKAAREAKKAEKAAKDAAEKTAKAAQKAAKAAADKAAKEAKKAEKAAKDAADKTAKEAADKATKDAADKAAKEAADKATKDAADKAAKEAAEKADKDAADKAAKEAADKATKEAAGKK